MEGVLKKRGGLFKNSYQNRYFVLDLERSTLSWFKDEGEMRSARKPRGVVSLECANVSVDEANKKRFTLLTNDPSCKPSYSFESITAEDRGKWLNAIERAYGGPKEKKPEEASTSSGGGEGGGGGSSSSNSNVQEPEPAAEEEEGQGQEEKQGGSSCPIKKLVYFPIRARAEAIRLCLIYAGQEGLYEEENIQFSEWTEVKNSGRFPYGSLPVVETRTGSILAQHVAILQYIGSELGLAPKNPKGLAQAMALSAAVDDVIKSLVAFFNTSEEDRAKKGEALAKQRSDFLLAWSRMLGDQDFFVENKMSFADFAVFEFLDGLGGVVQPPVDLAVEFPNLDAFVHRIRALPELQEHFEHRLPLAP